MKFTDGLLQETDMEITNLSNSHWQKKYPRWWNVLIVSPRDLHWGLLNSTILAAAGHKNMQRPNLE